VQNQTLAKLVDFLKHQPERPNSKQALVAWIYAFLLKESSSNIFRETLEPIVDASFPIINPESTDLLAHQTVSISTPEFLLDVVLLDGITAKNQTKTVIQTIAQLEAVLSYQRRNNMSMAPSGGLPTYLLLLSTNPKVAFGESERYQNNKNQLFSMYHGAYYQPKQQGFYHGKDVLKLQSTFEFEWRINHQADYHFCLAEIQLPIDFNQNKYVSNQQTRLELPRGAYREILANIAQKELKYNIVEVEELIELFSKHTERAFQKQLQSHEYRELSSAEKEQLLSLAMNSFRGKGNAGACYAQIHIHTINDKHRIHFGGLKSPKSDKNLFVILNPPAEDKARYGQYKRLKITAFDAELHQGYDIYFGKKGDLQKILS
jgi:hypothetical protein